MIPPPAAPPAPRLMSWLAVGSLAAVSAWWLWPAPGTSDVNNWLEWIRNARSVGPLAGYAANNADYPPGAALALWMAAAAADLVGLGARTAIKTLVTVALSATSLVVLIGSRRPGLAAFTQAALAISAIGLVYLDVLVAPFVLGAVWAAASGRMRLLFMLLAAACFIKWQPLLIVPFAALHLRARGRHLPPDVRARELRDVALIVVAAAGAVLVIYGWVALLALARAGRHGGLSNNAANLPWILGWFLRLTSPDAFGPLWRGEIVGMTQAPGWMLAALRAASIGAFGFVLLRYWRARDVSGQAFVRFALAGSLVYFLLHPGAHENHLFLSALLAIALAWLDRRWTAAAVALNVAANLNLIAFYGLDGNGVRMAWMGIDVTVWLALAVCALGAFLARGVTS